LCKALYIKAFGKGKPVEKCLLLLMKKQKKKFCTEIHRKPLWIPQALRKENAGTID
jgi:hypothetical protein